MRLSQGSSKSGSSATRYKSMPVKGCEGGGGSSKRPSQDSSSSGTSNSRIGGVGAVDAGRASKGGGFERTIRNMSTVLEGEVGFDLDAKKKQPSQDPSKRASFERSESAFIASEGESDLEARKKRLSQDPSNGDIGMSKSDVRRGHRPKPLSSSSDGNNRNSNDSSNRLKPLSSSSDGNNKSSPGRSRNETPKTSPGQTSSEMAENDKRSGQQRAASVSSQSKNRPRIKNRSGHCLCCATSILLLVVSAIAAYLVLQFLGKAPAMPSSPMTPQTATESPAASSAETILATDLPSAAPSIFLMDQQLINITTEQQTLNSTNEQQLLNSTIEQQLISNTAPTQSPLITSDVTIAIIVQLDGKPEETGFLLISADNLTTYISRPVGSLSNMQSEVVMEVVTIPKKTELVFTLEDASGDGLCCTHGDGYYRVFAGTGDQKTTILSGEQGGKYMFTVGVQQAALQIDGVDPNENCKPCPTGKDCGRCAWCDAKEGFMSDAIFSYQCHSSAIPIPKKCWIGEKRFQLHNQYVAAMAGCAEGLESWPQVETSNGTTLCVEEAKCIKSFPFVEPDCNQEFPGSLLVIESCQDMIGGIQFGYSWALNAPREKECASSSNFITSLASRCCVDSVAFCSTIDVDNADADEGQETIAAPAPTPIDITTLSPTSSYAPTWDGHPLTVLIQLDEFPQETGFSITSVVNGENVTFIQRREGYYTQSQQFVVENVQIPEGIDAVITLTDKEGDGFCCLSGNGYFQVYSSAGSVILDEQGVFKTSITKSFLVGEPLSLPPTVTASPSASIAPTFNRFPITVAVQLDQWSGETGLSFQSDGGETLFDWPTDDFTEIPSSLFIETVFLPNDSQVTVKVTDTGGDGFCCLYGDGYIKIFAGESAEDESALLAFETAEFESELQITFRVGPAPTVSPATTSAPSVITNMTASIGPTLSSPPSMDAFLVTVVLQLDKYSAETAWSIESSDGETNFVSRPFGYYEEMKSQKVIEKVHLSEGLEYQFKIVDFMGDGNCCWAGNGFYDLYEGEDIEDEDFLIFHGNGDFGQQKVHTFTAGEPKAPAPAPNGLRASSEPIALSAPSNVAQLITPSEPNTPQINSNAPSKNLTSASYNKTSSTGLPVLNISFHTSNKATPMLRGSVLYNRQRKHVENHP